MGKPTGFLDYTRVDCPVELPLSERNRRRQSGRCMDCGVPFCQTGASFEGVLLAAMVRASTRSVLVFRRLRLFR